MNLLDIKIKQALDAISNDAPIEYKEEWIEEAGETYKQLLRKQFTPRDAAFRLRMSNIGRPLCQLQMEQAGAPKKLKDYSFVNKMFIGDAVETSMNVVFKMALLNITATNSKAELTVNGTIIKGEDDIHFDDAVWDVKTCSPFAFEHKWLKGFDTVYEEDTFGYVDQLYGYATAQGKPMGGWIVINKSTGDVAVLECTPTELQLKAIKARIARTVDVITNNLPFEKCFEAEPEYFYKKATGNKLVPRTCGYCDYTNSCWPDAVTKPKARSKAKQPAPVLYAEFIEEVEE